MRILDWRGAELDPVSIATAMNRIAKCADGVAAVADCRMDLTTLAFAALP